MVINYIIDAGAIVLVILFQPELRRALERIGRGRIFNTVNPSDEDDDEKEEKGVVER